MRRYFSLAALSFYSAIWIFLLFVLQNFVGERTGFTALLTYFPAHIWGVLPAIFGVFCLCKRQFSGAIWNGAALAFWFFAILGFQIPAPNWGENPDAFSVRVVSYNVLGGRADAAQIAREIAAQKPDIVCLQESQNGFGERVAAHLSGWNCQSRGDVSTLSRFPILRSKSHFLRGTRWTMDITFQTPNGALRVVNTHVSMAYKNQENIAREPLRRVRQIVRTQGRAAWARVEQIAPIRAATLGNEMPTVLCGDFNTPPRGLFYRALSAEFDDAFAQKGFGVGATYPASLPLLRIDYVWLKNGARAKSAFVAHASGSDHLPLVCDVSWPQNS